MGEFKLEKWYLDVTDNSSAFIGYVARLQWKSLSLSYCGYIHLDAQGVCQKKDHFRRYPFPVLQQRSVTWEPGFFNASWFGMEPDLSETLLRKGGQNIEWKCVVPKGRAAVDMGSSKINGLGYVEQISLTFLPWKLPIDVLHWGRSLSVDHTLIWIKWIGPLPKTIVFFNGNRIDEAEISEFSISFQDYQLTLEDSTPLRTGTLLTTVFKNFKSIASLFPPSIMQLSENKWLSKSTLRQHGKVISSGDAIHEVVVWNP